MKRAVLFSLLILLSACNSSHSILQTQAFFSTDLSSLMGLMEGPLYPNELDLDNCAFDQHDQRYRLGNSDGGYTLKASSYTSADLIGADLWQAYFKGAKARDTAILVVDDFGNDVYTLGKSMYNLRRWDEAELVKQEQMGSLSHGAMVMNHVNAVIAGTGQYTASRPAANTVLWQEGKGGEGARIAVVAVNTKSATSSTVPLTGDIASKITQAFASLSNLGISDAAVVNMSFAILPCIVLEDFNASLGSSFPVSHHDKPTINTFQDYMQAVYWQNQKSSPSYDALLRDVIESTNIPGEPLRRLMQNASLGAHRNVYVASAGNFGLDMPLYPASWSEVISVGGSSSGKPADRAHIENPPGSGQFEPLFNSGEVMDIGASFLLTNPAGLNGNLAITQPFYYTGTSFSAPTVSVFSALDLALTRRCASGQSKSKLAHGQEQLNLRLEQAVGNPVYCQ